MMEDETLSHRTVSRIKKRVQIQRITEAVGALAAVAVVYFALWSAGYEKMDKLADTQADMAGSQQTTIPLLLDVTGDGAYTAQAQTAKILWEQTDEALETAIDLRYSFDN